MQKQNWFNVINSTDGQAEIIISAFIGTGDNDVNHAAFSQAIDDLQSSGVTTCKLIINCGGGNMTEALAIYDAARQSGIKWDVQVLGMAASMGSVLMLIGDEMPMVSPNAMIMFHKPTAKGVGGETESLRSMADLMDKLEGNVKQILVDRTGNTADVVNSWFVAGKQTWFNATQAVALGIARGIIAGDAADMPSIEETADEESIYNSVFNQITHKISHMKYAPEMRVNLGLDATATDAEVEMKIISNAKAAKELETLKAQRSEELQVEAADMVTNCIKDKKLTEADRKETEAAYIANPVYMRNFLGKLAAPTLPAGAVQTGAKSPNAQVDMSDKTNWGLLDWAKNDERGLAEMRLNNREAYRELCRKSGVTPE